MIIYCITNDINNKKYIGKTIHSIKQRFQEHIRESKKARSKDRPLYRAINKYGIEHFHIEILEQCSTENGNIREQFWIKRFNTFHYGYNATKGGEGTPYLDEKLIIETYKKVRNLKDTARICQCSTDSVKVYCHNNNIELATSKELNRRYAKPIKQFSKNNEYIQTFEAINDAALFLIELYSLHSNRKTVSKHIREVCQHKRNSAYGFKWEFATI